MPSQFPRGAGAARDEQSALLVPVPAAEPAVGRHRARLDESAHDGIPAHLTILYPFLPPALIDDAVRPHLPVEAAATEVALMAGPAPGNPAAPPGQWHLLASFGLGPPAGASTD